jgi:uracil-DNA glycosylase family 4
MTYPQQSQPTPRLSSTFRRFDPFANRPLKRVPGEGPQPCDCLLIGERPGLEEARRGKPFVGISGKYLNLCLDAANIDRSTLYITNLVKSYRDYQKPTIQDIADDHDELVGEIVASAPKVIVLIGAWSVEHVLFRKPELDKCHGVPVRERHLFGGSTWGGLDGDWIVLPMIHPASAAHSPDSLNLVLDDVMTLGRLLDGEIGPVVDTVTGDPDYRIVKAGELSAILRGAL